MLKYEVPVAFDIIMNMTPPGVFQEPPYLLIRTVCKNSKDPSFKKAKFFRYLREYAEVGLCCKKAKRLTPERKKYYEGLRKRKMERYVKANKRRLNLLKFG